MHVQVAKVGIAIWVAIERGQGATMIGRRQCRERYDFIICRDYRIGRPIVILCLRALIRF
jgi:hypothetical protein